MDLAQMKAAVTMEGLLSGAAALELIAEVERLRDQIEHPAAVVLELRGEISRLTALCDGYRGEVASLKEALDRIAHPVWWMQEDQLRATGSINGLDGEKTVALGRDHHFLKSIAERALAGAPIGVSAESALTRARADAVAETLDEAAELGSEWAMSYVEVDTAALRCGEYIKKYFKGDSK